MCGINQSVFQHLLYLVNTLPSLLPPSSFLLLHSRHSPNLPQHNKADIGAMAFTGGQIAGLVIGITAAFFICLIYFCKGAYVVNQSQVMIVERFGKYSRTLTPGFHWVWPYVEAPRYIDWRYISMNHSDTAPTIKIITTPYIDLREHVLDLQRRDVITKDTVQISVDALVYFRITDPRAAVYRIQNLPDAIEMLTQSTLRNIIAGLTLDETFSSREYVNDRLINVRFGMILHSLFGLYEIGEIRSCAVMLKCFNMQFLCSVSRFISPLTPSITCLTHFLSNH